MYVGISKGKGNIYTFFLYTAKGTQEKFAYLLHTLATSVHKLPYAVSEARFQLRFKRRRLPVRAFCLNDICSDTLGKFHALGHVPLHNTVFSVLRKHSSKAFLPLTTEMVRQYVLKQLCNAKAQPTRLQCDCWSPTERNGKPMEGTDLTQCAV
jgi:hypothetical protein